MSLEVEVAMIWALPDESLVEIIEAGEDMNAVIPF